MRKPAPAQYRAVQGRVRARLSHTARPDEHIGTDGITATEKASWAGRWTPVHRLGILGKPLPLEEQAARQARQLLARYGVVTRECLSNEVGA